MNITRAVGCLGLILGSLGSHSLLWADTRAVQAESPVKVAVTGASTELADNLKAFLPSLRQLDCTSPQERVQRFIDASQAKLNEGAEAMGYFDARFNMTPARQGNCWVLSIAVQPGPVVRVVQSNIRLTGEGEQLPAFNSVMANHSYQLGEILISQKYEDLKSSLTRTASRLGFFDAKFLQQEILVDIDNHQAVIKLHFETGSRYAFGEVNVEQDILQGKYLDRYIRIKPGEPYDSTRLLAQTRLLETSGYYTDVRISSRFLDAQGNQVPIDITAERRSRYTYTGTVGYGTGSGARIEAGMETHWLNSRGHKLDTGIRFSQKEAGMRASYRVPLWNPEFEFAAATGGWNRTDNNDIKGTAFNLEFSYNRRNRSDWQQAAFVNLLNEKTQVVGSPAQRSQLTLLGGRVSKKVSDDTLFPTQGWRGLLEVQGAHDAVLSDQTLLQTSVQARHLHTFSNNSKTISHGALGETWIDETAAMPKSLRYFAGGQGSVRGYDFQAIGEQDADGKVVGGKNLLVGGVEYEYPVAEKIGIAAFVDAGDAFDNWQDVDLKAGVGLGARYKSPLGPIRIDVAVPQDDLKNVHFYFSLGPDL